MVRHFERVAIQMTDTDDFRSAWSPSVTHTAYRAEIHSVARMVYRLATVPYECSTNSTIRPSHSAQGLIAEIRSNALYLPLRATRTSASRSILFHVPGPCVPVDHLGMHVNAAQDARECHQTSRTSDSKAAFNAFLEDQC